MIETNVVGKQNKLGPQATSCSYEECGRGKLNFLRDVLGVHDSRFAISSDQESGDGCTEASSGQHQSSQLLEGVGRVAKRMTENKHA